jgi:hypothetical protein
MNPTSFDGTSGLSQYAASLLAKQPRANGGSASASADALTARLTAAPTDFRSGNAQHKLDRQQAALGKELAAGLAKSGTKLAGAVDLTLSRDGSVAVAGSAADQAAVAKFFAADTSTPRLQARIASALKDAQSLSSAAQQRNAISLAARYGGSPGNVMSMYAQFMGHADATPASMSFDGAASTLHYPGALDSHA